FPSFFLYTSTSPSEFYTLSLHDALPILVGLETAFPLLYTYLVKTEKTTLNDLIDWLTAKPANTFQLPYGVLQEGAMADLTIVDLDRKSTRLNSSHVSISYAVFCLKKKTK